MNHCFAVQHFPAGFGLAPAAHDLESDLERFATIAEELKSRYLPNSR